MMHVVACVCAGMLKHGGIASDEQYGPYTMQDGFCHFDQATKGTPAMSIKGYVNVTSGDVAAVKVCRLTSYIAMIITP